MKVQGCSQCWRFGAVAWQWQSSSSTDMSDMDLINSYKKTVDLVVRGRPPDLIFPSAPGPNPLPGLVLIPVPAPVPVWFKL